MMRGAVFKLNHDPPRHREPRSGVAIQKADGKA